MDHLPTASWNHAAIVRVMGKRPPPPEVVDVSQAYAVAKTSMLCVSEDEQWLQNFRITRETFSWLVDALRRKIKSQVMVMREPITIEELMAIAE